MVTPSHENDQPSSSSSRETYHIARLNWAGLGVVDVKGKARCVPFTRVGERVEVRWRDAGWGRVIGERIDDEVERSRLDEEAGCTQARRCTGCSIRQLTAVQQRLAQEESHLGALRRLSGRSLDDLEVHWLKSPAQEGYRVRVTAAISWHKSPQEWRLSLRQHWGEAIDLSLCPNHPSGLRKIVAIVNRWMNDHTDSLGLPSSEGDLGLDLKDFVLSKISVQSGIGSLHWIILHAEDQSFKGSIKRENRRERLALGNLWLDSLPIDSLKAKIAAASLDHGLSIYGELKLRDQEKSSTGMIELHHTQDQYWRCQRGHQFIARPPAWLPQTPSTLESLREAIEHCLWGDKPSIEPHSSQVFELGCGVGLMGIALAQTHLGLLWHGVDIEPMAVECAKENASLNEVEDRVSFEAIDGRRGLAVSQMTPSHLVIHAMRRPLSGLLSLAAHKQIKRICYLAPSAPALARDLAEAKEYHLDRVFFIDQMPGTAQSMTIAQLTYDSDVLKV